MCCLLTDQDRVSEYEMKLMDIDSESVAIPVSTAIPVYKDHPHEINRLL